MNAPPAPTLGPHMRLLILFVCLVVGASAQRSVAPIAAETYRDQYVQPQPKGLVAVRVENSTYDYMDYATAITYRAATPIVIGVFALLAVGVLPIFYCVSCCRKTAVAPSAKVGAWGTGFVLVASVVVLLGSAMLMVQETTLVDGILGKSSSSAVSKSYALLLTAKDTVDGVVADLEAVKVTVASAVTEAETIGGWLEGNLSALLNIDEGMYAATLVVFSEDWSGGVETCDTCVDVQAAVQESVQDAVETASPEVPLTSLAEDTAENAAEFAAEMANEINEGADEMLEQLGDVNETISDVVAEWDDWVDTARDYKNMAFPWVLTVTSIGLLVAAFFIGSTFAEGKWPLHTARALASLAFFVVFAVMTIGVLATVAGVDACRLINYEEGLISAADRDDDIGKFVKACQNNESITDAFNVTAELTAAFDLGLPPLGPPMDLTETLDLLDFTVTGAMLGFGEEPYSDEETAEIGYRNGNLSVLVAGMETSEVILRDIQKALTAVNGTFGRVEASVTEALDVRCRALYVSAAEVRDHFCGTLVGDLQDVATWALVTVVGMGVVAVASFWAVGGTAKTWFCAHWGTRGDWIQLGSR